MNAFTVGHEEYENGKLVIPRPGKWTEDERNRRSDYHLSGDSVCDVEDRVEQVAKPAADAL